jgi:hypothetical protein
MMACTAQCSSMQICVVVGVALVSPYVQHMDASTADCICACWASPICSCFVVQG